MSRLLVPLKEAAGKLSSTKLPNVDCVAIDGFCTLKHFEKSIVKKGKGLAEAV